MKNKLFKRKRIIIKTRLTLYFVKKHIFKEKINPVGTLSSVTKNVLIIKFLFVLYYS